MLADGADEVIGHLFAHIFVTADSTAPDRLALRSGADRFGLGFDVVLIIFVGARRSVRKDRHEFGLADKERVRAKVNGALNFERKVRVRALCNVGDAVVGDGVCTFLKVREFIHVAAGLKTEMLKERKFRILRNDRNVANAGFFDHVMRIVCLVYRNTYRVGFRSDLHCGIYDTAV